MANRQTLTQQARSAIHNGNKPQARALLQQAIQQDPNDDQAWLLLAGVTDSPEQSLEYIERAEMLNPHDPSVAKARRWAEDRQQKSNTSQAKPSAQMNKRSWWKTTLWVTLTLIVLFGVGTAVILAINFQNNQVTESPRQITDNIPTPIINMTATPTTQAVAQVAISAEPHLSRTPSASQTNCC